MRLLDDWLKHYVLYNQYNESPESFHFWTGVGVVAAALRRKTWLPMGYFEWTPNFYIVLVAPPGIVSKSTSISIGQKLLDEVPGIHKGSSSITWQALIGEMANASEAVQMEDGLYYQMSCLSMFISELGNFLDFDDKGMLDLLVEMWDGNPKPFVRNTMGGGTVTVERPWINMLACTTPAWLSDNMPKTMVDGGFSARCIWLFEHKKKRRIAYPQRSYRPEYLDQMKESLIYDLTKIAELKGPFRLSEDAYKFGEEWYEKHCDKLERQDPERNGVGGYLARTQTHVHKLAMILSAARRDSMEITEQDLSDAVTILGTIETDMPKVFTALNTSTEMEVAGDIVGVIRQRQRIRRTELYQMFFHKMSSKEFGEAISSAIEAGYISQEQSGATVWLRALTS